MGTLPRLILAFALIAQLGAWHRCCAMADLCERGHCPAEEVRVSCCSLEQALHASSCCAAGEQAHVPSCDCRTNSAPPLPGPVEGLPASTDEISLTLQLLGLAGPLLYETPRDSESPRDLVLRPPRAIPTSQRLAMACVRRE